MQKETANNTSTHELELNIRGLEGYINPHTEECILDQLQKLSHSSSAGCCEQSDTKKNPPSHPQLSEHTPSGDHADDASCCPIQ